LIRIELASLALTPIPQLSLSSILDFLWADIRFRSYIKKSYSYGGQAWVRPYDYFCDVYRTRAVEFGRHMGGTELAARITRPSDRLVLRRREEGLALGWIGGGCQWCGGHVESGFADWVGAVGRQNILMLWIPDRSVRG